MCCCPPRSLQEDDSNVQMDFAACQEQAAWQVRCGQNSPVLYGVAIDNSPVLLSVRGTSTRPSSLRPELSSLYHFSMDNCPVLLSVRGTSTRPSSLRVASSQPWRQDSPASTPSSSTAEHSQTWHRRCCPWPSPRTRAR